MLDYYLCLPRGGRKAQPTAAWSLSSVKAVILQEHRGGQSGEGPADHDCSPITWEGQRKETPPFQATKLNSGNPGLLTPRLGSLAPFASLWVAQPLTL